MKPGIGKRLYFSLGSTLAVLWLTVVASVAWVVEHETSEVFDSALQETAQRLLPLAVHDIALADQGAPLQTLDFIAHDEYLVYQVLNQSGEVLLRSHKAPAHPLLASLAHGFYNEGEQRIYMDATRDRKFIIQVAESLGHRQDTFYSILTYLLLPLLGLLPLAGLAIYWSVRSAQRPIRKFDLDIASRNVNDLRPLSLDDLPVELCGVGKSVNLLLERLRLALEAERSFTANSAHELRTPVATAMAQLQVLQHELSDPLARERVMKASEMLDRLQRMGVKLLQLARAESGVALCNERFDLGMLVGMLCRDFALTTKRELLYQPPGHPVWVLGDIDAVGIALQNLLENADRYGAAGTPIEIRLEPEGRVVVSNDCEPIPPEKMQKLRQRFFRGTQEKQGSGLGLSIVEAIARQSEGSLQLQSPCHGRARGVSASLLLRLDGA